MMRTLLNILRKELIQLVRTPTLMVILILCPIITVGLIPFGLGGMTRLRVEVIDHSNSDKGKETVIALSRSPFVKSAQLAVSEKDAFENMDRSRTDAVVIIRENGEEAVAADASHLFIAIDVNYYIEAILAETESKAPETVRSHTLFVSCDGTTHYFMMAMIVLMTAIICACLPTLSVVKENETKILEHLRSTGMKASTYVISKNIFFISISIIELLAALLLARSIFDLSPAGPTGTLLILFTCFFFAMVNLGIAIASFGKTMVRSIYVLVFVFLILILLSTMFAPLDNMPEGWAATRFANPFYWIVDGEARIILKGVGMNGIIPHICMLLAFGGSLCAINIAKIQKID